jgi:GntR family transcriptional repressor for pyruvate dehydrogenase complex
LTVPRMSEVVAAQLRARIVGGDLQDGDELPKEAQLLEEFGVSRPSLREAVRILETEGLLRIRRGKIGGAIVSRPSAESAAYHLGLTLQSRHTTLDDLATARTMLEPTCAALAAAQDDETRGQLVARLTELVDESERLMDEPYAFTECALRFHAAIVHGSGNRTITLLTGALEAVWSSQEQLWAQQASSDGGYPDVKLQRDVVRAHRRLISHIDAGDTEEAARAMRGHLAKSQPFVSYGDVPIEILDRA